MKVEKHITVNLGNYESLRIGVEDVDDFQTADTLLVLELNRLNIPVSEKIRHVLAQTRRIGDKE